MTCDFQKCGILTSVDSDEPVQPPFKLRSYKCCLASSLTVLFPAKKETDHVELFSSQENHRCKAILVYIGAKVYQVLLHSTSFTIRRVKCVKKIGHEPGGSQIVKSPTISVFIMFSCWIQASRPKGTQTPILCKFYLVFVDVVIYIIKQDVRTVVVYYYP